MQFGIGILGKGWTLEWATADALASGRPPRPNFWKIASKYAAKIAAESVLAEPPATPDLSDEVIIRVCAGCAHNIVRSEAPIVRDEFHRLYSVGSIDHLQPLLFPEAS